VLEHRYVRRAFIGALVLGLGFAAISTISADASAPAAGTDAHRKGKVLYRENWESGALDTSQWGAQCNNVTEPNFARRGSFTIQSAVVGQGHWAARFDLPADADRRSACEVIHDRRLDLGTDDYFALQLHFPRTWREPGGAFWGLVVAQFNYEAITGPPVGLAAHRDYVNLLVASGYFNGSVTQWRSGNGVGRGNLRPMYAIPRPLKLGLWHELIVHVRWSSEMTGAVDVWHRLRGRKQWKRTVRFRGYPTVQWSQTRAAISEMGTTDKIGGYRGESSFRISVFNDAFCRATTFRAAASCL
jgi:hypothetical protein